VNFNKSQVNKRKPKYQREKKGSDGKIKMCSQCRKFVSSRYWAKHKKACNSSPKVIGLPINMLEMCLKDMDKDFYNDVVSKLRQYTIGNICMKDEGT